MFQIIYSSESSTPMQLDDLEDVLEHARASNAAKGITGALVYVDGMFLQILEGNRVKVQQLIIEIYWRDLRHEAVKVLQERGDHCPGLLVGKWPTSAPHPAGGRMGRPGFSGWC